MKRLNTFLVEKETEAKKQAVARGLEYRGFGYWADPKSGEVVARSSGDQLNDIESEVTKSDAPGEEPAAKSKGKSFDDIAAAGAPPEVAMGKVLPGEEKAPKEDDNWTPGPDGDNDVDNPEGGNEVESDVFIDKDEDDDGWVAGPDGSNFKNFKSFDAMQEAVLLEMSASEESAAETAERMGLTSDGHGYWVNFQGQVEGKTVDGKFVEVSPEEAKRAELGSSLPGRETMRDMVAGKKTVDKRLASQLLPAKGALAQVSPSERDAILAKAVKTKEGPYGQRPQDMNAADKQKQFYKDMGELGKEGEVDKRLELDRMNEDIVQYVSDPDYNLEESNWGTELGDGAFGSVYLDMKGENVIKRGEIGRNELQALDLLKDLPAFPNLINAKLSSEFRSQESQGNTGDTWWNNVETAEGTFAMSKAVGIPFHDAEYEWDEITHENTAAAFWQSMAEMHRRGVSHNDLHGGNIFWDSETGQVNILDLGLANVDKFSALMEGLSSISGENYQLTHLMHLEQLPQEMQDKIEENKALLIDTIADDYSGDEWEDDTRELWTDLVTGDIRMRKEDIQDFRYQLDLDEEQIQKYIDILYDGIEPAVEEEEVDPNSLSARMERGYNDMMDKMAAAQGYTGGEGMKDMFNAANNMRRDRGEKELDFKGFDITRKSRQNK